MTTQQEDDRADDMTWQRAIERRLDVSDARMVAIEQSLKDNTDVTKEVRDFLTAMRGGFKVLGWLGTGAKWIGYVAGAVAAVAGAIYTIKTGGRP